MTAAIDPARWPDAFPPPFADAWGDDSYGLWAEFIVETPHGKATQRLRWIEPGTFLMGSPDKEPERQEHEGPQHPVTLTQGFWLADTACTQALWKAVMGDNPSHFKGDSRKPVEQVNWNQAMDFLRALENLLPRVDASLPTEAEWEYACRAGTTTPFSFGVQITTDQAHYNGNFPYADGREGDNPEQTMPVKSLPANTWGLYEMHGNVAEWCADSLRIYDNNPQQNPQGFAISTQRTLRGGSWYDSARHARSAFRLGFAPSLRYYFVGFRLCLRSRAR